MQGQCGKTVGMESACTSQGARAWQITSFAKVAAQASAKSFWRASQDGDADDARNRWQATMFFSGVFDNIKRLSTTLDGVFWWRAITTPQVLNSCSKS